MKNKIHSEAEKQWEIFSTTHANFKKTDENYQIIKSSFIKGYLWRATEEKVEEKNKKHD